MRILCLGIRSQTCRFYILCSSLCAWALRYFVLCSCRTKLRQPDDFWIRLTIDQRIAIHSPIQPMSVSLWINLKHHTKFSRFGNRYKDPISKALSVSPPLLGIINASYSLGAICDVPFAPAFNQWVGRRWAIMCGSIVMIIGALLQGFAQQGMYAPGSNSISKLTSASRHAYCCTHAPGVRDCLLHHLRFCYDWRISLSEGASHYDFSFQLILLHWRHCCCSYCVTNR